MSLPFFLMVLFGCCGFALWRGGAPERVAAALQLGAYAIDLALNRLVDGSGYAQVQLGSASLDLVLFGALTVLAWRSTRFWPLWIAGWQLAAIVAHAAKAFDPGMVPSGYAFQAGFWAYPMLLATAAGGWRHHRRVAGGDADPGWKPVMA